MRRRTRIVWIGGILGLLCLAGFLYFQTSHQRQQDKSYEIKKSGAGGTVDFSATAYKIHTAVNNALAAAGLQAEAEQEGEQRTKLQGTEGAVSWSQRKALVKVADEAAAKKLETALVEAIQSIPAKIIERKADQYQGYEATRLDIGLQSKVDNETITCITDRIYLVNMPKSQAKATEPQPKPTRARMAIVVDDFGYAREPITAYATIDRPLTFAILPYRMYSNEAAQAGSRSDRQLILHLPMEPLAASEQSEATTITVQMSDEEIRNTADQAIRSIPGIIGVNNHQGSRATADKRVMSQVLSVVKEHGLFFLDSRTTSKSVAIDVAGPLGIRTTSNDLFLDNNNEVDAIKQQIRTAANMALRYGAVTVIGHARLHTATAIKEMIPELEAKGIRLVFASELLS